MLVYSVELCDKLHNNSWYSHLPNKLKWVAFSENNGPKTKNYTTRSYKILQKAELAPIAIRQVRVQRRENDSILYILFFRNKLQ